ncbi:hypothetical protein FDA94_29020 [Herbidospora galbida]|uniref:Uncharacterized protein n=1 Tax=Herbidospora galbida TaxID=2575442 RepID=A0A4U3M6U3_9ACTN|nr:hypothetical protein [Herbidospora galbida]TKK84658.1 hypothetical protein FDA94_29020 [Herbidospora galbida]
MRTLHRRSLTSKPTLKTELEDFVDATVSQLRRSGIAPPDRPAESLPGLPDDVTELDGPELMSLYQQMIAWSEYASGQLALAEIREQWVQEELGRRRAAAIVKGTGKTATALKAGAADDPLVAEATALQTECYALRKLIEPIAKSASGRAAYLSRELTRRTDTPDLNRRHRWTT